MSEKFSLKWNDYLSNWNKSLSELRNDNEFADVTLISDDKVKFSAHKILLSSCSSMLKFILKSSNNANPLLFLGGVSSVNLGYILDYIYQGEVNIYQEQLDSFLESARKLEIEGLLGSNEDDQEDLLEEKMDLLQGEQKFDQPEDENFIVKMIRKAPARNARSQYSRALRNDGDKIDVSSMTPEETEERIKDLYQKTNGNWSCLACAYTNKDLYKMKRHIETHIDGLSYTCTSCDKEFRSKQILEHHMSRFHRN